MSLSRDSEYLGVKITDAQIAIDVKKVQEVYDVSAVTRVPSCPPFVAGIANVRGTVVPVIDLFKVFDSGSRSHRTVILKTGYGPVGLPFPTVDDIMKFESTSQACDIPAGLSEAVSSITGYGTCELGGYFIIDPDALIESILPQNARKQNQASQDACNRPTTETGDNRNEKT
jgi:purine-binding chemotaxis protein CheW